MKERAAMFIRSVLVTGAVWIPWGDVMAQEVVESETILEVVQERALGVRKKTDTQNYATPETSPHVSLSNVTFEYDSADLTTLAKAQLDEVVTAMQKLIADTGSGSASRLRVEGHTDDRGSDDYNLDLSQRRAQSVKAYLVAHAIPADLVEPHGWGETRPSHSNATDAGRAQNRRVDFVFREYLNPNEASETRRLLQTNKSFLTTNFTASMTTGEKIKDDAIETLSEGDGIRMDIEVLESCFVSIVYLDTTGTATWVYPSIDDSVPKGVWTYYPEIIHIPEQTGEYFLLDDSKGHEFVVVFSAQSPIEKAEELVSAFTELRNSLNSPGALMDARDTLRKTIGPPDLELQVLDFEHR